MRILPCSVPLLVLFLSRLVGGADLEGLRVTHVGDFGPPSMRVDVVILGEGYVKEDLRSGGKWSIDTARLVKNFFEKIPFKGHRALFNVHLVEVESLDRGADDNPGQNKKRTAFDACYGNNGVERLLVCRNEDAVLRAARNAPDVDIIIVLVNDPRDGGSGGEVGNLPAPVCSNHPTAYLTAIHELGHSFAGLGDEYVDEAIKDSYPIPDEGDLPEPNLTLAKFVDTSSRKRLIETLKWGHYLEEAGAAKRYGVGYFEGGYYRSKGVYRPARSCIMFTETGGGRFCFVCIDAMTMAINRTAGRGPAGGVFPVVVPRMKGRLRRPHYYYNVGLFGRTVADLKKLEKKRNLNPDETKNIEKLRAGIEESLTRSLKKLERLDAEGEALSVREHSTFLAVSFKGTEFYKNAMAKTTAITRDRAFKKELKAGQEYLKLLAFVHSRPPRSALEKRVNAFTKKYRDTRSEAKARKLLR